MFNNKMKKYSLGAVVSVAAFLLPSSAMADGAAMAGVVGTSITDNSEAMWTVGGSVIVLSVIGLIIRKIRSQAS